MHAWTLIDFGCTAPVGALRLYQCLCRVTMTLAAPRPSVGSAACIPPCCRVVMTLVAPLVPIFGAYHRASTDLLPCHHSDRLSVPSC